MTKRKGGTCARTSGRKSVRLATSLLLRFTISCLLSQKKKKTIDIYYKEKIISYQVWLMKNFSRLPHMKCKKINIELKNQFWEQKIGRLVCQKHQLPTNTRAQTLHAFPSISTTNSHCTHFSISLKSTTKKLSILEKKNFWQYSEFWSKIWFLCDLWDKKPVNSYGFFSFFRFSFACVNYSWNFSDRPSAAASVLTHIFTHIHTTRTQMHKLLQSSIANPQMKKNSHSFQEKSISSIFRNRIQLTIIAFRLLGQFCLINIIFAFRHFGKFLFFLPFSFYFGSAFFFYC